MNISTHCNKYHFLIKINPKIPPHRQLYCSKTSKELHPKHFPPNSNPISTLPQNKMSYTPPPPLPSPIPPTTPLYHLLSTLRLLILTPLLHLLNLILTLLRLLLVAPVRFLVLRFWSFGTWVLGLGAWGRLQVCWGRFFLFQFE